MNDLLIHWFTSTIFWSVRAPVLQVGHLPFLVDTGQKVSKITVIEEYWGRYVYTSRYCSVRHLWSILTLTNILTIKTRFLQRQYNRLTKLSQIDVQKNNINIINKVNFSVVSGPMVNTDRKDVSEDNGHARHSEPMTTPGCKTVKIVCYGICETRVGFYFTSFKT